MKREHKEGKFIDLGIEDLFLGPITLPFKGFVWIAERIEEAADEEMLDEDKVMRQLLELEFKLETGEISEEEYEEAEKLLLERLDAIREYKKAH